jgi:hypothetical protein
MRGMKGMGFLSSIITPLFGSFVVVIFIVLLLWMFAGPQVALKVGGSLFGLIFNGLKLVFSVLGLLTRQLFLTSKEYVSDTRNKKIVWNISGLIVLLLCLIYLAFTPKVILDVYYHRDNGWLILGIVGLFAIKGENAISQAPILKKDKNFKVFGQALAKVITVLTTASGVVHLVLFFLYPHYPKIALISCLLILLVFIGYITSRLMEGVKTDSPTLARFETAVTATGNGEKLANIAPANADLLLAYNEPTLTKQSFPVIIPEGSRKQHMQILGPTGTGKTILALNTSIQDAMNPGVGLIILEPTKDFTRGIQSICKKIGRKSYYVDPTDPNTVVLNPLDGDDIDEIAEINASAFIGYLGPNANEFYRNKQKNALRMAIKAVKYIKGDEATYLDLLEIIRPTSGELRDEYIKKIKDNSIRKDLEEYQEEMTNPRMINQAIQNYNGLIDYLKELTSNKYLRNVLCAKSTISLREVFNNGEVLLVTTAYGKLKHLGFVLGRLLITMLQSETFARTELPEKVRDKLPPIAVYIDEVQNYVSEPFKEIFEMARKAGMMMTIIHQDLAQLADISEQLKKVIFNNARQKVVFGGIDIEDCQMFSKRIGEYYENIKSTSYSAFDANRINVMNREELRAQMTPTEIFKLPGFNPNTFEPAKVLLLTVVDNEIKDAEIGLVSPLPKQIFEDTEEILNIATGQVTGQENLPINNVSLDSSQILSDTVKVYTEKTADNSIEDEMSSMFTQEIENQQNDDFFSNDKKRVRRKRGKSKGNIEQENNLGPGVVAIETLNQDEFLEDQFLDFQDQQIQEIQEISDEDLLLLMDNK